MADKNKHIENSPEYKSLMVSSGVEKPSPVDAYSVKRFLGKKRNVLPVEEYVKGILSGDIALLSKAVTLVESSRPEHQRIAQEIIEIGRAHV